MTYANLKAWIETLTPAQLQCDVSVHDIRNDEWYPVTDMGITNDDDVLNANHPVLGINEPTDVTFTGEV